jgi:hypothetical protein
MLIHAVGIALTDFIAGDLSNTQLDFDAATYDIEFAKFFTVFFY